MRSLAARGLFLALLAILLAASLAAQDRAPSAAPVSEAEVVERLSELQDEIERLLPFLAPELRREIAHRLAERAAAQEQSAERAVREAAQPPPAAIEAPAVEIAPAGETGVRGCNTLDLLDTSGDGRVDAGDRYWRYLYLWTDGNGDGEVQEREVRSAFDAGVRGISVRLDRFDSEGGGIGLIRIGRWIVLDPRGDGFSGGIGGVTDDGALTVDASALGRFSGPRLLDPEGKPLAGMQPFRPGLRLRDGSGKEIGLSCP